MATNFHDVSALAKQRGRQLLVWHEQPARIAVERRLLTRRDVNTAVLAAGSLLVTGAVTPFRSRAAANPAALLGSAAFIAGVTWLVTKVLDKPLGNLIERAEAKPAQRPPSANYDFHNQYACPWEFPEDTMPSTRSEAYGYYLSISRYCRSDASKSIPEFKDWNERELAAIEHLHAQGEVKAIPFPCGPRQRPTPRSRGEFEDACDALDLDADALKLEYSRPFNDGRKRYRGFGVARPDKVNQKSLVFVEM